jgi:hypothetical protein
MTKRHLAAVAVALLAAGCGGGGSGDSGDSGGSATDACVARIKQISRDTGQSVADLSRTYGGSSDPKEACRKAG